MRIRKLAKDLETDETALMELLRGLGHVRYTDPEQQLPGPIEAQVRRHARSLPKVAAPLELPVARPRPMAEAEPDLALFERAMATVRPIGPQPKAARPAARPAPRTSAPTGAPPAPPQPPARPPEPARGKVPEVGVPQRKATPASTAPRSAVALPPPLAAAPRAAATPAVGAPPVPDAGAADRARAPAAEQHLADEQARSRALLARVAELEALAEAAALREADLEARATEPRAVVPEAPVPSTLRACFERRGLLGEDEMASALRAILDAHRVNELLRIELADPEKVDALLWERILLLAEDDPTPPGVVAVRVPPERSEGVSSSVNRAAMSRFSTACLVHNIKRIVIVGGSPAYHRTLRDGLDPRLDVRLIPGNRRGRVPSIPSADLVILWASTILDHSVSAQFPDGLVIPHRSVARMLGAATEWIEAR